VKVHSERVPTPTQANRLSDHIVIPRMGPLLLCSTSGLLNSIQANYISISLKLWISEGKKKMSS